MSSEALEDSGNTPGRRSVRKRAAPDAAEVIESIPTSKRSPTSKQTPTSRKVAKISTDDDSTPLDSPRTPGRTKASQEPTNKENPPVVVIDESPSDSTSPVAKNAKSSVTKSVTPAKASPAKPKTQEDASPHKLSPFFPFYVANRNKKFMPYRLTRSVPPHTVPMQMPSDHDICSLINDLSPIVNQSELPAVLLQQFEPCSNFPAVRQNFINEVARILSI